MSNTDIQSCDQCGSELPRGIPAGLCPRCVLADTQDATSIVSQPLFSDVNAPQLPRSFGDYELLEEIARGGMGVVYKARQKSLERIVALKMLLFGAHSSSELVRRFRAEAVLAAGLHHPTIVAVHEVGIHDGQPFLVMDYVDGLNLSVFLRTEPISIREAVLFLHKIAVAIHYAHERNVLHRDLKPSNILLDTQREPHVTDFGLARRIDGESTITISGQVLGSPNYMPPEQAAPRKGKVSRRSDVYGLGAILYHCLTGRPPFQAETLEATLHLVVTADAVSPRLLNPSVPLDLETICLKCLEKDPARRYHTAEDLAEELSRFLNNCPIQARPTTRGEKLARWCRRNPPLAVAIGTAVLFLISGLIVSMLLASQAAREASSARLHLYLANMSLARQALAQNNFSAAREKLLAHTPRKSWADLRGWEWRHLWRLGQPDNARSFNAGDSVHALALSPDGKFVAAGSRDGNVRVVDLDRDQVVTNVLASPADVRQKTIAYSPDGSWLGVIWNNNRAAICRPGTWERTELARTNRTSLYSIAFSPDSRFALATGDSGLEAWELSSRLPVPSPVRFTRPCKQLALSADGRWLVIDGSDSIHAWDLSTSEPAMTRLDGSDQLHAIAISRAGMLVTADRNGVAHVWDLTAARSSSPLRPHHALKTGSSAPIFDAAFSPDNALLALAGSDQVVRIYGTSNWTERTVLKGHNAEVWSVAFSSDGTKLVSGAKHGAVKVWDPHRRPSVQVLAGPGVAPAIFPLAFTPDNRQLVAFTTNRALQFWNVSDHTLAHTMVPKTNLPTHFVELTPDTRIAFVKSSESSIHLLDARTGDHLGMLDLERTGLEDATPWQSSPDSRFVAVGTKRARDGQTTIATELFDLNTKKRVVTFEDLRALRFSQKGRFLGGKTSARQLALWDIERRTRRLFEISRGDIFSIAFSPDDRLMAASNDEMILIWNLHRPGPPMVLNGHNASVGKILFSRDGLTLFSTSTDRTVKMWNVATGVEVISLPGNEQTWEMALSPDGTTLAVGGTWHDMPPVKLWFAPSLKDIDAAPKAGSGR